MPITAPKPTDSLATGWATDPDTREEPTSGQKESGWTNGQRPAFNVFNWVIGVIYDWLAYFETATDELDDEKYEKTGGTITGDVDITDDLTVGDDATIGGTLSVGANAVVGTTLAVGTDASVGGSIEVTGDGVVEGNLSIGGDTFAEKIQLSAPSGSEASTAGRTNELVRKSLIKAWGRVTCNEDGTFTVDDGFNVTDVVLTGSNAQVNLADNMADTNYAVILTPEGNAQVWILRLFPSGKNVGSFIVDASLHDGTDVDLATAIGKFSFLVLGAQ